MRLGGFPAIHIAKYNEERASKIVIDFIAEKQGKKLYVQVTYKLESRETVDREFSPLLDIRDQYPKYVVTMDDFWKENVEGVQHVHISDFLLMEF